MANNDEKRYLDLMSHILEHGEDREDRTGVGTKSVFGTQLRFSLEDDTLPLLTTKKMFLKGIVEELLFFIRGETDTKKLEAKGVNIWKGNTSREFLDRRGLSYLPEGNLGKGYGKQWRAWGYHDGWYTLRDVPNDGIDQLSNALHMIKNDPTSRKIIVSAWNVEQLKEMALEPCHYAFQFYVSNGTLSCLWNQRSVDTFLGLGFNIASYAILTHMMAKAAGLKAKELIFNGGDTHLYNNHIDAAKEQLSREPYPFPKLNIKKGINSIEDMENLSFEDFEIVGYQNHPAIKAQMSI